MKVAVSGKGGVGKTTLAACLARLFARGGHDVIAIDADLDSNLAAALGVPSEKSPRPIVEMAELIAERTESTAESYGKFFKLNPTVSDIPEKYSVVEQGVRVMVLGGAKRGGSGCACPENVFLKALLSHMLLQRNETLIVDLEAGVENLGRATCAQIDALVIVVEPGRRSAQTAGTVTRMAADIGVKNVFIVANKVRSPRDLQLLCENLPGDVPLLGTIGYNGDLVTADLAGQPVDAVGEGLFEQVEAIRQNLIDQLHQPQSGSA